MLQAYGYVIHLLSGLALLALFFFAYTKITPFEEISLIRQGNIAAAFSLGGALLGFSLTVTSSIVHNDTYPMFLAWGASALLVQVIAYAIVTRAIPHMNESIASDNVAMGAFMGAVSTVVGAINAACLS